MAKLKNIHPGVVLKKEFLEPLEISMYRLSKEILVPQTRMSEIIHGRRSISADTAVRLSIYFGNSANFWLGLQNDYDLEQEMKLNKKEFAKIGEAKYDRV
ncbi:MAG: HigA family addiction module antidote protein [Saprospiraceae bacterium]|nr:HigA family addiction module antidote protein [Saprospiraceae bacterium]MBK8296517.1 HigA family addiction module antidote protein [Saprospiraceae bacterium]